MATGSRTAGTAAAAAGVAAALLLAGLAAAADENEALGQPMSAVRDVGVGLVFVLAGFLARGPTRQRVLIAAVGPAWLLGSLFQRALSLHQAVLLVVLLAAPSGRLRGPLRLSVAVLGSGLLADELLPQPAVGGCFVVVAAAVWLTAEPRRAATTTFAGCAAAALALVLVFGWWAVPRGTSTSTVLAIYQATLVSVALGFAATTWVDAKPRTALADRVLGDGRVTGLEGLRRILADVLHDADLEIALTDHPDSNSPSGRHPPDSRRRTVPVYDGGSVVGVISSRSAALADGPTVEAVVTAVGLTAANLRLHQEQARQVLEVEASRVRLLAAVDRERRRVAARLRSETSAQLEQALAQLATPGGSDREGADLRRLVQVEIASAAAQVERIVAGAPPAELGSGRLGSAIMALAARSPVPVVLELADDAGEGAGIETALFYVCSETLTNIAQHSGATRASVRLCREPGEVVMIVRDNGHGGANVEGLGFRGLRDRLAAIGGDLDVTSSSQDGTVVAARVPTSAIPPGRG